MSLESGRHSVNSIPKNSKFFFKNHTVDYESFYSLYKIAYQYITDTKTDLNEEEQIKVRTQLIDILKMLPTFVIIALPGSFLTLPLLLKILPKDTLPTEFQNDQN